MIMLSKRDKAMIKFIERYGGITTIQARVLFFNNLYSSTIRRLCQLERANILKGYKVNGQKCYGFADGNRLTEHDIGILDFYLWVYNNGGQVIDFIKEPHNLPYLRPDILTKFTIPYKDKIATVCAFVEYDLTHYTDVDKVKVWYEKLYREEVMKEYCGDLEFPVLIIARPTQGIRYNSQNFQVVYCELDYSNLYELLL